MTIKERMKAKDIVAITLLALELEAAWRTGKATMTMTEKVIPRPASAPTCQEKYECPSGRKADHELPGTTSIFTSESTRRKRKTDRR
jgi:hypothetical protein